MLPAVLLACYMLRLPVTPSLVLLLLRALPTCAQSSCPAGTADLDGDGECHQCWDYVPHFRAGHGQWDV
eukprot:COSAG02_NODE_18930_length_909_cov_8.023457_1_plen_68_part_01